MEFQYVVSKYVYIFGTSLKWMTEKDAPNNEMVCHRHATCLPFQFGEQLLTHWSGNCSRKKIIKNNNPLY